MSTTETPDEIPGDLDVPDQDYMTEEQADEDDTVDVDEDE